MVNSRKHAIRSRKRHASCKVWCSVALYARLSLRYTQYIETDTDSVLIAPILIDSVFQPSREHVHPSCLWPHAYFTGCELRFPGDRIGQHSGSYARIAKEYTSAFRCLKAHIIDTAEMAICVVMYLVGSARGADIDPGL